MEDIVIEQGAGTEPAPAAPAGAVSGTDGAVTMQQPGSEADPGSPTGESASVPPEAEDSLIQEIRQLWDMHRAALAAAKRGKEEALAILLELGRRLSEAKDRLARPGRNGGWSSFARSLGFSRAEADGLVRRYRRTLKPQAARATEAEDAMVAPASGASAADAEARPEAAGEVVAAQATGQASQPSGEVPATAAESPASALATEPVLQTSDEASTATREPAAEAAGALTETGLAAAVADAGSGAVA